MRRTLLGILVVVAVFAALGMTWRLLTVEHDGCSYSTETVDVDCGPNGAT